MFMLVALASSVAPTKVPFELRSVGLHLITADCAVLPVAFVADFESKMVTT
jgi:hypothetical protein